MSDSYGGSILPTHAIYPSSVATYIGLLVATKFFRAVGLFLSYDLLKLIPVVQFLFIIKAGSAVPLILLQKPFGSGKKITKNQWFRITKHAFFGSIVNVLWMFGLTLCGPLRTILLYEHSDLVVIAGASALFTSNGGGPAKMRGAVFFLVSVVTLLLFDHDERLDHEGGHGDHHTFISHLFNHFINFTGWSDHKGGVVLLFLTLCLQVGFNSASKKLSIDVGGAKRLHTLSTLLQTAFLCPWALFIYFTKQSEIESWSYLVFPLLLIIFCVFILDYYIEAVAVNHVSLPKVAQYGSVAMFVSALFLSVTWNHPLVAKITTMHKLREIITEDHVLSGGVVFSLMVFMLATSILAWPSKTTKGSFVGFSPAGMPLYSFTGLEMIHRTSHIMPVLKNGLRQILEEPDSRKIFYFLCINLMFTFVELAYGGWTNSLGLISDGFHMLFDCSALVMGLYASVMSRWKATRIFSFGYDRVEVLSGFINGLYLVVIAVFVFTEAFHRLFEPPEISTERLLAVSVTGLLVNLVGIAAFSSSHGHSHGGHGHSHKSHDSQSHGSHGHSHGSHGHSSHGDHGHGHSHGGSSHGHSQSAAHEPETHNTNMEGVYLHVLADTMGSVGVIISSLLIEYFGWNIADPICSLFIATMILLSVLPLLKETSMMLLLKTPSGMEKDIGGALDKVLAIDGVLAYRDPHIWNHTSSRVLATLHIQVIPETSEQKIISQITSIFKEAGIHEVSVQVEKEAYFHHMSGMSTDFDQMVQYVQNFKALKFDSPVNTVTSI